jgi:hypothetical protein
MAKSFEYYARLQIQEALRGQGGIDIPAKPAAPAPAAPAPEAPPTDAPKDAAVQATPAAPSEDILTSALKLADANAGNAEFGNIVMGELKKFGIKKSTMAPLKAKVKDFVAKNEQLNKLDPKVQKVIKFALMIKMADPSNAKADPEAAKDEPKADGKQPGEEKMTMVGAARKAIKTANETKDPAEAEQKAESAIKKAGLKEKLQYYEDIVYEWIAKLPLVGRWFAGQSKTKQRIIVLVTVAVVATLIVLGVKWAKDLMGDESSPNNTSKTRSSGQQGGMTAKMSAEAYATKSNVYSSQLIAAQQNHGDLENIVVKMAKSGFSAEQIADTLSRSGIHGEAASQMLNSAATAMGEFSFATEISKAADLVADN